MSYREMLVLSYFKSHYKKYEYNELIQLLGITMCDLNTIVDSLIKSDMLYIYEGYMVLSRKAEEYLEEYRVPLVGVPPKEEPKKRMSINEI